MCYPDTVGSGCYKNQLPHLSRNDFTDAISIDNHPVQVLADISADSFSRERRKRFAAFSTSNTPEYMYGVEQEQPDKISGVVHDPKALHSAPSIWDNQNCHMS